MGPGPSELHPRVIGAVGQATIGHLDPEFVSIMERVKALLQYGFRTENALTFPVSGPGSAGMETCFVNLVEPGDTVVVCVNGVFGGRMKEVVEKMGGNVVEVQFPWGDPVDPDRVEEALRQHPDASILAFVHAETSTGVLSDAKSLTALAHQYGCLSIVDAVTSFAGSPLYVDDWEIDAIYTGSQKCLSSVAGISPISISERALEKIRARTTPVPSWFLDLGLVMGYWGGGTSRTYHHTAPVNSILGLAESLELLKEEGLENAWQRHAENGRQLTDALQEIGFEYLVAEPYRLPQLHAVFIPAGVDDARTRRHLLDVHGLEIGAGLGPLAGKIWRIGLMGYTSRPENVRFCVKALITEMAASKSPAADAARPAAAPVAFAAG